MTTGRINQVATTSQPVPGGSHGRGKVKCGPRLAHRHAPTAPITPPALSAVRWSFCYSRAATLPKRSPRSTCLPDRDELAGGGCCRPWSGRPTVPKVRFPAWTTMPAALDQQQTPELRPRPAYPVPHVLLLAPTNACVLQSARSNSLDHGPLCSRTTVSKTLELWRVRKKVVAALRSTQDSKKKRWASGGEPGIRGCRAASRSNHEGWPRARSPRVKRQVGDLILRHYLEPKWLRYLVTRTHTIPTQHCIKRSQWETADTAFHIAAREQMVRAGRRLSGSWR